MTDIKPKVLEEINEHLNEIVLSLSFEATRLIGFAEDNHDYYYILERLGGKRIYDSCVGKIVYLKHLPEEDYKMIERVFTLNSSPGVSEMVVEKLDDWNGDWIR